MHQVIRSLLITLLATLLLAGCTLLSLDRAPAEADTESTAELPTPTDKPSKSEIPVAQATLGSPTWSNSALLLPQPTADARGNKAFLPTPTQTPGLGGLVVTAFSVNVRSGPSTAYDIIDIVDQDEEFDLVGRNEAGDWWQACCFNGEMGWFFDELVNVENPGEVSVVTNIPPVPLPTPTVEGGAIEIEATEVPVQEDATTVVTDTTPSANDVAQEAGQTVTVTDTGGSNGIVTNTVDATAPVTDTVGSEETGVVLTDTLDSGIVVTGTESLTDTQSFDLVPTPESTPEGATP